MERCLVANNRASYHEEGTGAGVVAHRSSLEVIDTVFRSNFAASRNVSFTALGATECPSVYVEGCRFIGNNAAQGVVGVSESSVTFRNSWFSNPSSYYDTDLWVWSGDVELIGCTFGPSGQQLTVLPGASVSLNRCAFGAPADIRVDAAPSVVSVTCSVFHGSGGELAAFIGQDGNLSADPLFCDPDAEDFRLQWGSPCLPAQSGDCGTIGAFGFGGCNSVSVERESWARVKARYRR